MPERSRPATVVIAAVAVVTLILGVAIGIGGATWFSADTASAGSAGAEEAPQGPPPALVRVAEVTQEPLREQFDVIGRLQQVRRTTVAAEVSGKIVEAQVEAGDQVVGGETVLARIDDVWANLELEAAEARVAAAEATLAQSRSDLTYLEQLAQANSARPREVEDARSQVKADEAALNAAVAERETARHRVERLVVTAPFDGAVVEKLAEVGQWVNPGMPIAQIISTGEIEAVVNVPESLVSLVRVGEPVEVLVEPLGQLVTGNVIAVVPSGGNSARTFPVKVRLNDADGLLKTGMSVVAHLPVGEESPRLTVPRDAVLFSDGGATVWAAVPGDSESPMPSAVPFRVEVLFGQGDRLVIQPLSSLGQELTLSPQMPVVIEGAERLIATQPLQIVEAGGARAQAE